MREPRPEAVTPSSTSAFQTPQASQRPVQRAEAAPQFWQTNVFARATMPSLLKAAIDQVAARGEAGENLVAYGTGRFGDLLQGNVFADESREIAAVNRIVGNLAHIYANQVH